MITFLNVKSVFRRFIVNLKCEFSPFLSKNLICIYTLSVICVLYEQNRTVPNNNILYYNVLLYNIL